MASKKEDDHKINSKRQTKPSETKNSTDPNESVHDNLEISEIESRSRSGSISDSQKFETCTTPIITEKDKEVAKISEPLTDEEDLDVSFKVRTSQSNNEFLESSQPSDLDEDVYGYEESPGGHRARKRRLKESPEKKRSHKHRRRISSIAKQKGTRRKIRYETSSDESSSETEEENFQRIYRLVKKQMKEKRKKRKRRYSSSDSSRSRSRSKGRGRSKRKTRSRSRSKSRSRRASRSRGESSETRSSSSRREGEHSRLRERYDEWQTLAKERERAEAHILESERFKGNIEPTGESSNKELDPGNTQVPLKASVVDPDDKFMFLTCHVDKSLRTTIGRGGFVELEKLLRKNKFKKT